jgi:hypothetical protein
MGMVDASNMLGREVLTPQAWWPLSCLNWHTILNRFSVVLRVVEKSLWPYRDTPRWQFLRTVDGE